MKVPGLTHWIVATAQVGLSYFFLAGYFTLLILQGLGIFKADISGKLEDVLMLVMSFWFMRQRVSGDEPPKDDPKNPQLPANPAQGTQK